MNTVVEKIRDTTASKIKVSETDDKTESPVMDSTSSEFFIKLLQDGKLLTQNWIQKLQKIDDFFYDPQDSLAHVSLIRSWVLNDSISVIIFSTSNGTSYDEFLITIKNKHDLISSIHISDNDDSDISPENPYYYTKYKLIDNRHVKLFNHKVVASEGEDEIDRLISVESWTIQSNGLAKKR